MPKEKAKVIGNTIMRIILSIVSISICWIGSWWCPDIYTFYIILLGTVFSVLISDILKGSFRLFNVIRLVIFCIGLRTILGYIPIDIPKISFPLVIAGKTGFLSSVSVTAILTSIVSIIQHELGAKL